MKGLYLVNYSVKGIKALDQTVSLSFYKKTITKPTDFRSYNIKGIYGINGSGKSAIITSVKIFRNLLVDRDYLNNPIVQRQLRELINKKVSKMEFAADFLITEGNKPILYHYEVTIKKEKGDRLSIERESLSSKAASSRSDSMDTRFEVQNGRIVSIITKDQEVIAHLIDQTNNLLKAATVSSLFLEWAAGMKSERKKLFDEAVFYDLLRLYSFGISIFVYLDQHDDHSDYVIEGAMYDDKDSDDEESLKELLRGLSVLKRPRKNEISIKKRPVLKEYIDEYEKRIERLYGFISIFKRDLKRIVIDKTDEKEFYNCDLIMEYENYKVSAEFESTGIKKLIKLYEFFDEMAAGDIVFIDELDSNLHDVYLCALLEYLMEYGEGQLCFTTHNIGPMDILKRNKKSIDFLSVNHKIYPWVKNGNYSPANLYKNGMIEGSPFNIDSTDFIGVFSTEEGED